MYEDKNENVTTACSQVGAPFFAPGGTVEPPANTPGSAVEPPAPANTPGGAVEPPAPDNAPGSAVEPPAPAPANTPVSIPVARCRDGALLPRYTRVGDAGMDICAAEDVSIYPGQTVLIPTGLKFAIPLGYEMQIRPRSGISLRTALRIPNSPGTIDSGFRDEVGVIMTNTCLPANALSIEAIKDIISGRGGSFPERGLTDVTEGDGAIGPCVYKIKKGDRIAQVVISTVQPAVLFEVDSVSGLGVDRSGGFGSTGVG